MDDEKHGFGKTTFGATNNVYIGEFMNDEIEGTGRML